jgi:Trk K+ transport system NAD-binding subunit
MKLFGRSDAVELPVVAADDDHRLVGCIRHRDVIEAYNQELAKRNLSQEVTTAVKLLEQVHKVDFVDGFVLAELPVPASFVGRTLCELNVRARFGVQVLLVKRLVNELEVKQIVPSPDERIRPGDLLVLLGSEADITTLRHL